jgi:hypothetical protein
MVAVKGATPEYYESQYWAPAVELLTDTKYVDQLNANNNHKDYWVTMACFEVTFPHTAVYNPKARIAT